MELTYTDLMYVPFAAAGFALTIASINAFVFSSIFLESKETYPTGA